MIFNRTSVFSFPFSPQLKPTAKVLQKSGNSGGSYETRWGLGYLVVVRDDGGNLSAGQRDVLSRQVVDGPGAGVQGVVEGVLSAVAPVPAL